MSKKTFNPSDWVPDKPIQNSQSQESLQSFGTNNDIEEITRRIQEAGVSYPFELLDEDYVLKFLDGSSSSSYKNIDKSKVISL